MRRRFTLVLLSLLLVGSAIPVAAQESEGQPTAADLFTVPVPTEGGIALLSLSADTSGDALEEALTDAGCRDAVIALIRDGRWQIRIAGAPAVVNANFPEDLEAGTALYVRCAPAAAFTLTLLHHDSGTSQLLHAAGRELYGGIARFKTVADRLRVQAARSSDATIMVSAGGNLVARPEFKASIEKGVPYYDAIGMRLIGYDAIVIGSQEFDFGPDVFENFIRSFGEPIPFVSANLDVSAEPELAALVEDGWIAPSAVVTRGGVRIGIVGATTPELPFVSSPRDATVDANVAAAVQREIDRLTGDGVEIIIVASFLQGLQRDLALLEQLRGADIVIGGGGGELLANPGNRLIPGDEAEGPYPYWATDANGKQVALVGAPGGYTYIGRLVASFDASGRLISVDADASGPVRVSGTGPDVATPDLEMLAQVVEPVQAALDALASTVVGTSEVALDLRMTPGIRTQETNAGDLVADAILWQARALAEEFGVTPPTVALLNSGALRGDTVFGPGPLTELQTYDIAPFASFVTVVEDVSPATLRALLETAVSRVGTSDGRFAQVAGLSFTWDPSRPARTFDAEGNVTSSGSRIREVVLDDGTVIVRNGVVVSSAPSVSVATLDFLARGGDQYPFGDGGFEVLGVTYRQALRDYVRDALGGRITAAKYPEGGEGRILVTQ